MPAFLLADHQTETSAGSPRPEPTNHEPENGPCVVEEVASGDWGIGGQPLSTQDVVALAKGVPVG
jgi:hypothetical protein